MYGAIESAKMAQINAAECYKAMCEARDILIAAMGNDRIRQTVSSHTVLYRAREVYNKAARLQRENAEYARICMGVFA